MRRMKKAELYEAARSIFRNLMVYQNPEALTLQDCYWIAHGMHRELGTLWTATGRTEREALERLLGLVKEEVHV